MNKTVLTVIAISTLFLGFAGSFIYADDEAAGREIHIVQAPNDYKYQDYDGTYHIVKCTLPPSPPNNGLPVCKIRWYVSQEGATRFVACLGGTQIGDTAKSLADIKKEPELIKAIRDNICRTDASYNAPESYAVRFCSNN